MIFHTIEKDYNADELRSFLMNFWTLIPKRGRIAIFDRSWYGRILVERVEGFCSEGEWKRAYREINEFENILTGAGTIILKFWLIWIKILSSNVSMTDIMTFKKAGK